MSELTHEQADGLRDAIALIRVLKGNGGTLKEDLAALLDNASKDEITMMLGVLLAMAADRYDEDELSETALNALRMRP